MPKMVQIVVPLATLAASCSSPVERSPAETRRVVTAALLPCDAAVRILTVNLAHATGPGAYRMASQVEGQCQGATLDIMKASLPGKVREPCQGASESARIFAAEVEAVVSGGNAADEVRLEDSMGAASAKRQECDRVLTHLT